jgi:hypothetical protein
MKTGFLLLAAGLSVLVIMAMGDVNQLCAG